MQQEVTTAFGGWDDGGGTGEPVRRTLGDRYPELTQLAYMSVDAAELRQFRLTGRSGHLIVDWLHNNGCYLIGDALDLTDEDMLDWPGIGRGEQAILLEFFRDVAADALSLREAGPTAQPALLTNSAVDRIATWARVSTGARTWGEAQDALTSAPVPEDVQAAVIELRSRVLPDDPPLRSAEHVASAWIAGLDDRNTAILRGRLLQAPPNTLDDIGKPFGVSRERVRQLETKLKTHLDELMQTDTWRPVRWRIFDLRERLGSYAPADRAADALIHPPRDDLTSTLLLWLAGYRREAGAVRRDGYSPPHVSRLPRLEPDLPLLDQAQIRTALIADGVRPELVDWAIDSFDGIARHDDQLVVWPRSIVEKSYALLAVRGTPLTTEELAAEIGGDISVRSLRQRLLEDPRMCRATRTTIGLKAWGGEEYTTLVDLMSTALEEHGPTTTFALIEDLVRRFDVNPTSVLAYSAAPIFVVENGTIRLRRPDEPYQPRLAPEQVPGLYRDGSGTIVWNVLADHDLMRGSGRALPAEIAAFLGVAPGERLLLSNPTRDVPVSWLETSHMGPNIGSLKALAESVDAQRGDHLHIRFDRSTNAVSLEVCPDRPESITIASQIAWLTGLRADRCTSREALAQAVQVRPDSVVHVLNARGDALVGELASQLL
ncbi:sigma factor-like helix-turn-helix DNA-binding protein [Actinotalea sp. AC32]|nr:sigma factor-like helix-turn-helix DNA-binding protein [Actinotalea sp. AC32]